KSLPTLWLLLAFSPGLTAGPPALRRPAGPVAGALVIAGGGALPDSVRDRFLELAGGKNARLVYVPTAGAGADGADSAKGLEYWQKQGAASVVLLHPHSRADADDPAF